MSVPSKIKKLLDDKHVAYKILQHAAAYTAQEIAGAQHVPGKQVIKPVILKADDSFLMCIVSANQEVDFNKIKKITGAKSVRLASEFEMQQLFPEEEVGAELPLGEMYGLKVYIDRIVPENDEIIFNAGTHTNMISIKYHDFLKLTKPVIGNFAKHI